MAVIVGGTPALELRLNGELIDHEAFGLSAITTSDADEEAGLCSVTFDADQLAASGEFYEGMPLSVRYGWNGDYYPDSWDGALEASDPRFSGEESITLHFYGPSFQLRNANNPVAFKGTRREAAERVIRHFGLTPDVRITGSVGSMAVPDGSTAWEALQKIARASNSVVAERAARTVYLGPNDAQPFIEQFWYRTAPSPLSATVLDFNPHWTRKQRLAKVTVIGVGARSGTRFEGVWEYVKPSAPATTTAPSGFPPKDTAAHAAATLSPADVAARDQAILNGTYGAKAVKAKAKPKGRKPKKVTTRVPDPDARSGEITLYLPVRSKEEAQNRAKSIGVRGESLSRTATLIVPITPVTNGQTIRVLGERLGRYAGAYYVRRVERMHLEGTMTLELDWKEP